MWIFRNLPHRNNIEKSSKVQIIENHSLLIFGFITLNGIAKFKYHLGMKKHLASILVHNSDLLFHIQSHK